MGVCLSSEEKAAINASKEVDAANRKDFEKESDKRKLLLLGAGESGKSTIFKQMKILYGVPLTENERRHQTPFIYHNTIQAVKVLASQVIEFNKDDDVKDKDYFQKVCLLDDSVVIDDQIGEAIKSFWTHQSVQQAWERRNEFQICDSLKYFCENIDRIMQFGYLATQEDLLYARVRTTGVVTERYSIDNTDFELYDVGGQRNERKKWIHCFDNVTSVIFVAALSEFDQLLYEDDTKNRMVEAIELFAETCNNRYFQNSSIVLFLNKKDLFSEKIATKNIKSVPNFHDYSGEPGDFQQGVQYFLTHFLNMNEDPDRQIFHHITCATDTSNVKIVFEAVKDTLLRSNLKDTGLMD